MAKALASDVAELAAKVALQVHGAIGHTWECDLHFFMQRAWALSKAWGDATTHRQLVLAEARRRARALKGADGHVRFPPVIGRRRVAACRGDRGSGTLLPGGAQQGRPLRRRVLHRRDLDRYLLSPQLPGAHAEARERPLLPVSRRGPTGGFSRLPPLPARRHARLAGMEHPGRRGGSGHAAHTGRDRRPRRRGGTRPSTRLQRAATEPTRHHRGRHRTAGHCPGPACADGAHLARDDHASHRPRRLRRRIFQRPPMQRDIAADLRRYTPGTPQSRLQSHRAPAHGSGEPMAPRSRSGYASRVGVPSARSRCSGSSVHAPHPGIETVEGSIYRRSMRLPHGYAVVALAANEGADTGPMFVEADLHLSDLRDLTSAVARCRQLLDLDADPVAIVEALERDRFVGPLVSAHPGRRVPGSADGFELAVRAIIGQQVSVAGARTIAGRLVSAAGEALPGPIGGITPPLPHPRSAARADRGGSCRLLHARGSPWALAALAEAVSAGSRRHRPRDGPFRVAGLAGDLARHRTVDGRVRRPAGAP